MRSRIFQSVCVLLFLAALLVLRHGILWMDDHIDVRREQAALINAHDIDPGALFYTELVQALAAEKAVRTSLDSTPHKPRAAW